MTTPTDPNTVDDDVDFGDQFANLGETPAGEGGDPVFAPLVEDKVDDDVEFGDQFADLGVTPAPLDASIVTDDIASAGLGSSAIDRKDLLSDNQYASEARDGGFGLEFANLGKGGAFSGAPKPLPRESFKMQLQGLDGIDLMNIDEESESPATSLRTSVTGKRASLTIDERLRASAVGKNLTKLLGLTELESMIDEDEREAESKGEVNQYEDCVMDPVFTSQFAPDDMRCLALVAHNHMKPAMKEFVLANKNLLRKFKLTGTNTTMTMLREVFGSDASVKYGPTCTSGPLGGDAELVAVMCTENLGGIVFFIDPMSAHPHSADIECLSRQANVHNILMMPNPATAYACMASMHIALKEGKAEMIPSFFMTLSSPSVAEYKTRQARVVERNRGKK